MMNRREFLKAATLASAAPLWVRFSATAAEAATEVPIPDRLLLVVYLGGGNDGLNTVVPYQDSAYTKARPTVGLRAADVNSLGGGLGLHKALARVYSLWTSPTHQLAIVQNVGYPNPNYSHFESTYIWETGSATGRYHTGWLGRYLDATDATSPGPVRAIAVGMDALPRTLIGQDGNGVALTSLSDFSFADRPSNGYTDTALRHRAFDALGTGAPDDGSLRSQVLQAEDGTVRAIAAISGATAKTKTNLTDAQTVAAMFAAKVGTEIGFIEVGGFDTHTDEKAFQAQGLQAVDKAIGEFFDAAKTYGIADRVTVMTFTDFGRRVGENANVGTDHGSSGPLLVMGPNVNGGIYGNRPDLSPSALQDGNLVPAINMASVYSSIISQAFHTDPVPILGDYPTIPLIR